MLMRPVSEDIRFADHAHEHEEMQDISFVEDARAREELQDRIAIHADDAQFLEHSMKRGRRSLVPSSPSAIPLRKRGCAASGWEGDVPPGMMLPTIGRRNCGTAALGFELQLPTPPVNPNPKLARPRALRGTAPPTLHIDGASSGASSRMAATPPRSPLSPLSLPRALLPPSGRWEASKSRALVRLLPSMSPDEPCMNMSISSEAEIIRVTHVLSPLREDGLTPRTPPGHGRRCSLFGTPLTPVESPRA